MFEILFTRATTIATHKSGPLAEERELFLRHCAATGATPMSQRERAHAILRVAQQMSSPDVGSIDSKRLQHILEKRRPTMSAASIFSTVSAARPWLKFLGWWQQRVPPLTFANELDRFVCWMRDERGLTPCTIEQWRDRTARFLRWCADTGRNLISLKPEDIDAYFVTWGAGRWSSTSAGSIAVMLRVFLRHAGAQGTCPEHLFKSIQSPCNYRLKTLPYAPDWDDVRRLIDTASGSSEMEVRDRAILLLLAVYGLRSGEVAALRTKDVDFDAQRLHIWRLKRRQPQTYPLVSSVAEALQCYVSKVRPDVPCAELFICARAPRLPLSSAALYHIVATRVSELGLQLPHRGPHALRHACATRMLTQGLTLKEIGDHLGHRSASSAAIYTKVDFAALRHVGEFDLGGLQ